MATDPKDHPVHAVSDELPRPPGDLPPSAPPAQPTSVPPPGTTSPGGPNPYSGEIENEEADPVGAPPRL